MAFFRDLSPYAYALDVSNPQLLNIGWLDIQHPFPQGPVDEDVVERLWGYCHILVREFRGLHDCDFCIDAPWPTVANRSHEKLTLGSAELRIPGQDGIVYAAPNMIYHYVTVHHYQPPVQFMEAVRNAPAPCTPAYLEFLDQLGEDYLYVNAAGEIAAAGGRYQALAAMPEYRAAVKAGRLQ